METLFNGRLSIEVSAHGAELCSIFSNGKEYLWQADLARMIKIKDMLYSVSLGMIDLAHPYWVRFRKNTVTYMLNK